MGTMTNKRPFSHNTTAMTPQHAAVQCGKTKATITQSAIYDKVCAIYGKVCAIYDKVCAIYGGFFLQDFRTEYLLLSYPFFESPTRPVAGRRRRLRDCSMLRVDGVVLFSAVSRRQRISVAAQPPTPRRESVAAPPPATARDRKGHKSRCFQIGWLVRPVTLPPTASLDLKG